MELHRIIFVLLGIASGIISAGFVYSARKYNDVDFTDVYPKDLWLASVAFAIISLAFFYAGIGNV